MSADLGEPIPALIASSRALAEVHRLDLALFVAFEKASLRIVRALVQQAPPGPALTLCLRQADDDARHHASFQQRLTLSLAATAQDRVANTEASLLRLLRGEKASRPVPLSPDELADAVVIPPLRRFLQDCYAHADAGRFGETITLLNLVLKGMAAPLYSQDVRYWQSIDPALAALARTAGEDERRHVVAGLELVRGWVGDDPARLAVATEIFAAGRQAMRDVSRYYVRKFVASFAVAARQHADAFAGTELASGQRLTETSEVEQAVLILGAVEAEHTAVQEHLRAA